MFECKKVGVVIPAAGSGTRLGGRIAKQFLEVEGVSILGRTLRQFQEHPAIDCIAIAGSADGLDTIAAIVESSAITKVQWIGLGGVYRQDSVWNAFQQLYAISTEIILVHDAVRPFVSSDIIDRVLKATAEYGSAVAAVRAKDTIKISNEDNFVLDTPGRETLWQAQTPQGFSAQLFMNAFLNARQTGFIGTDDTSLVEQLGAIVKIVEGSYDNIKITTPDDFDTARRIALKN